jgi:hypothetical protein
MMSTIKYFTEPGTAYETFDGVIVNASESGLCILTAHLLNKGQIIEIKSNGDIISQTATVTVRWTRQYNNLYYKVGLEFTK